MIHWLSGKIETLLPNGVILNVNGVGYGIELPLNVLINIPKEGVAKDLWIFTHVREDSLRLFGFDTQLGRQMFALLLGINGVGPKVAIAMMSTLSVEEIIAATRYEQPAQLERVPGIGKRTAERILVELKPRIEKFAVAAKIGAIAGASNSETSGESGETMNNFQVLDDARSGLSNLGFKAKDIDKVLAPLSATDSCLEFQEIMRQALQKLTGGSVKAVATQGLESNLF